MIPWPAGPGPHQPGPVPLPPSNVSRAALGRAAGVGQESRSSGRSVVVRQVQGNMSLQVRIRSTVNEEGQARPVITKQVHSNDAGLQSGLVQTKGVHGQHSWN